FEATRCPQVPEHGSAGTNRPVATVPRRYACLSPEPSITVRRNGVNASQHAVPASVPEPKVQLPEPYHGDRKSLRGFLNQLRLVWQLQPPQYHNDALKVGLLGTTGPALRWFSPMLEAQDPRLNNATVVIQMLEAAFGSRNIVSHQQDQMPLLRPSKARAKRDWNGKR
ncbi:hypothetical protein BVRB_033640, partial [Beta vulgaris subsp. vulgaris]